MTGIKQKKARFSNDYWFTGFFAGLLLSTYVGYSEEYLIICGIISLFSLIHNGTITVIREKKWLYFIIYYFCTTIAGYLLNLLEEKQIMEFFIQYPVIILILVAITRRMGSIEQSMAHFKVFIFISCIYGLFESIIRHNYLPLFFSTPVMKRITTMNLTAYKYQSSSFFLHYSYFGVIILVGFAINMIYPFQKKGMNIIYIIINLVNLYFSRSRMCLLALLLLVIFDLYRQEKITVRMLRNIATTTVLLLMLMILFWDQVTMIVNTIYSKFAIISEYGLEHGSFGQRFGTLSRVPIYMLENPVKGILGTGFNSIKKAFLSEYSFFHDYGIADNQLTTFLIEIGLAGTTAVIFNLISFFRKNKARRSLSKYLLLIILISSITLDVIGTVYITALVIWPFVLYYEYERRHPCSAERTGRPETAY